MVRLGRGTSPEALLIQVYTPTQHANFMADPFSGRIAVPPGGTGSAAYGQGASQNKAHMAAMLAVLKLLVESRVDLPGTLYVAVNNEGRSSHACTEAILSALAPKPRHAILAIGTGMQITAGNRGRVDIHVRVTGKACHSSDPDLGAERDRRGARGDDPTPADQARGHPSTPRARRPWSCTRSRTTRWRRTRFPAPRS